MLDVIILFVTCVINLGLGALVLVRNPKLRPSIYFFLVSVTVSLWAASNYYAGSTDVSLTVNEWANRVAFLAGFLAIIAGLRFTQSFVRGTSLSFGKKLDVLIWGSALVTSILSVTPLIAGQVTRQGDTLHFSVGILLPLYVLVFGVFIALIARTLSKVIKVSKGRDKQQALFVLVAFSVPLLGGIFTNAILPAITSSWHTAAFGPALTIVTVGTITYSIVKHKLFDIRFAVARSFAYLLSILTIITLYVVAALGVAYSLFDISLDLDKQIFLIAFSILSAILFQPVLRFFNKVSNRLFYRDAYEPQDVLDKLSTVLVGTVDVREIREQVAAIFAQTLRPTTVQFILANEDNLHGPEKSALKHLLALQSAIVVTDELPDHSSRILLDDLQKLGVALSVQLRTSHDVLGYMLLGYRKSGVPYASSDQRLMGVVADELALAIQNANRFQEIQNFNITLQEKIEDATKRLRETNAKLKALDQTKDDFISMASHQLRTPLTSVKGYVSMVLDGDAGEITPLQRKLLNQSFVSSQRMVYLISDLLNVSRLRTGKFVIEPVPTNLVRVVEDEVSQLQETAKGRDLSLTFKHPETFPSLMLDETKIRQVIMNFMDNAIYYTPAGGEITVSLVEKAQSIEFTVVDNGIGVPKHEQHHLFSKFYRAHNAKRARPDGTGLGLFMAKKVIAAQGGAIIFRSQEKKGSTFGFTFAKDKLLAPTVQ